MLHFVRLFWHTLYKLEKSAAGKPTALVFVVCFEFNRIGVAFSRGFCSARNEAKRRGYLSLMQKPCSANRRRTKVRQRVGARLKNTHKILKSARISTLKTAFSIFSTEKAVRFSLILLVCFCSALNDSAPFFCIRSCKTYIPQHCRMVRKSASS